MRCNGKCHLSKLIKENQEQEKEAPNTAEEKEANIIFLTELHHSVSDLTDRRQKRQPVFFYKIIFSSSYLKEIFHPPKFA